MKKRHIQVSGILALAAAVIVLMRVLAPGDQGPPELIRVDRLKVPERYEAFGRIFDGDTDVLPVSGMPRQESGGGKAEAGRVLYERHCLRCHGGNLDGGGRFADALIPRPADFMDPRSKARLTPGYLFWRISTGDNDLPTSAAPLGTAMPRWDQTLSEHEVAALVRYLVRAIDDPGNSERAAGLSGQEVYDRHCASCHGKDGMGDGPSARSMTPAPRNFWLGVFKYKTTHADVEFPSEADLHRTITNGLPGTSMAAWGERLSEAEISSVIQVIRKLGMWDDARSPGKPVFMGTSVETSVSSRERGEKVYRKNCEQCHGLDGRGDITSGKRLQDDMDARIWPRNLTRQDTWRRVRSAADLFNLISTGIRGTPMPQHTRSVRVPDRWHVVNYVMALDDGAPQGTDRRAVLKSTYRAGALPDTGDDPVWQGVPGLEVRFAPNAAKNVAGKSLLNETALVQAVHNEEALVMRIDVDDRTLSVPGDAQERRYALAGTRGTRDAIGMDIRLPGLLEGGSVVQWTAQSIRPEREARVAVTKDFAGDFAGPEDGRAVPLPDGVFANATWQAGRWRFVVRRALSKEDGEPVAPGVYPFQVLNKDGLQGDNETFYNRSGWWWLDLTGRD